MRVIDGDGHIFEDNQALAKYLPADYHVPRVPERWFPPLDRFHSFIGQTPPGSFRQVGPDGWLEFMEDVGLESAVLYPTGGLAYGNVFHLDWAIALGRAYNDWLAEAYLRRSPRFKGMALIPMQEPEAAVVELRRAVEELGFVGAMLPSTGLKDHLGAKEYWPVYAEADRLGCALAVHGGAHSGLGFDQLNDFSAVHALGHPLGIAIVFASLAINGIFDRFPNARFGFMEGGVGWFLMALERLEGSFNAFTPYYPKIDLRPGEAVSDYLIRHVRDGRVYVGVEGEEPDLAHAVRRVGAEAFVFSSDFPHEVNVETCAHEVAEVRANGELSDEAKRMIFYENARRFYGLKRAAIQPHLSAGHPGRHFDS